eukprot:3368948-Amphidinium_carterae.1
MARVVIDKQFVQANSAASMHSDEVRVWCSSALLTVVYEAAFGGQAALDESFSATGQEKVVKALAQKLSALKPMHLMEVLEGGLICLYESRGLGTWMKNQELSDIASAEGLHYLVPHMSAIIFIFCCLSRQGRTIRHFCSLDDALQDQVLSECHICVHPVAYHGKWRQTSLSSTLENKRPGLIKMCVTACYYSVSLAMLLRFKPRLLRPYLHGGPELHVCGGREDGHIWYTSGVIQNSPSYVAVLRAISTRKPDLHICAKTQGEHLEDAYARMPLVLTPSTTVHLPTGRLTCMFEVLHAYVGSVFVTCACSNVLLGCSVKLVHDVRQQRNCKAWQKDGAIDIGTDLAKALGLVLAPELQRLPNRVLYSAAQVRLIVQIDGTDQEILAKACATPRLDHN